MFVRIEIELAGQMLGFERLVSAVRRRALEVHWLHFRSSTARHSAQVTFAIETEGHNVERLEAILWKLEEVRKVTWRHLLPDDSPAVRPLRRVGDKL